MKKKVLSVLFTGMMGLMLAACSSGAKSGESANTNGESGILTGKTIGFSQTDSQSAWRIAETESIKKHVEEAGGKVIVKDAGGDLATQESDITDLVAAGVDYLIAAPLESEGLQTALQEAMSSDIPVILVDRKVEGEAGVDFTTSITSDFIWEGEQAAKTLIDTFGDEGGNVVTIQGGLGSSTAIERQKGFVDALKGSNVEIIVDQSADDWLMDTAQSIMENVLQAKGEEIDAVYCHTDDMAQGAIKAIEAAGYKVGTDILVIGIDGSKAALEAVESGKQLASVTCSPYFGPIIIETLEKLIEGEELPESITNEDVVYTKDNVDVSKGF